MSDDGDNLPDSAPWWAKWLVAEWRDAWRWLSTWLIAAAACAPVLYEQIDTLKDALPGNLFHWIETGIVVLIFLQNIKRKNNGNGNGVNGNGRTK